MFARNLHYMGTIHASKYGQNSLSSKYCTISVNVVEIRSHYCCTVLYKIFEELAAVIMEDENLT